MAAPTPNNSDSLATKPSAAELQAGENVAAHSRLIKPLCLSVAAAILLYGGFVVFSDPEGVLDAMALLGWTGWAVILGLSLFNYLARFLRWRIYMQLRYSLPNWHNFVYYLSGFAFTTTPGKAGEAVRSYFLNRHNIPYAYSVAAFFAERFLDVAAMGILALLVAFAYEDSHWMVVGLMSALIVALPVMRSKWVLLVLLRWQNKYPQEAKLHKLFAQLASMLDSARLFLANRLLMPSFILGLLAWAAEGVAFYIILVYLGLDVPLSIAVGIYSLSALAGALSFLPGGLGGTEAIMGLMLIWQGADSPTAVAATLICRIATLWFAVAIGAIAFYHGGKISIGAAPADKAPSEA